MAKFCAKCGKKLEEGKKCNCEVITAEKVGTTKETTKNLSQLNAKDTAGTVIEIVKGIFIKPVATVKKLNNEKNFNLGLIILALAIIAQSLFITMNMKEAFSVDDIEDAAVTMMVVSTLSQSSDGIQDYFEDLVEFDDGDIEFNFVKGFTSTLVFTVVIYAALLLSLYLVIKVLMKKEIGFKKLLTTISITSCINIVLWLAALVLLFLVPSTIAIVVIALGLYYIITLYQALFNTENLDENKFPLMYSIAYAAVIVILYVLLQII